MSIAAAPKTNGDILLEAGTNELEVLVFRLAGGWYGVNVAKVREVIRPNRTAVAPHQHPSVIGMFNIRGAVIPVVDLAKHLGRQKPKPAADAPTGSAGSSPAAVGGSGGSPASRARVDAEGRVIITEFNGMRTGFLVEGVDQIHRVSWQRVRPAPDLSRLGRAAKSAGAEPLHISSITGLLELNERLVLMIDFESVADAIVLNAKLHPGAVPNDLGVDRGSKRVVLVEDSPFMRAVLQKCLVESGYRNLEIYSDGEAAWQAISTPGARIDAIISDIEMPRMDGLHLTRRIKESESLKAVPVVLFSSLVSQDNLKKGQAVGADVQIPKPELPEMVRLVDKVVSGRKVGIAQTGAAAA